MSNKSSNIIQNQDINKDSVKILNTNKTVESKVQAYGCFTGSLVSRTEKSYTFDFDVNGILGDNIEVWLEYEYFGFENPTAFSRSINDEVAIGGYVGTKNNTWKSHKEKISPESLRSGDNKILFSLADNLKTRFGIRNVKCYIQPTKTIERSLYVNQPVSDYFSGKYGFVNGFIQGKGSEQAELKVNGVKIKRNSNQFEKLIVKPENTDTSWTALIEAVYPDGETIATTVEFTKPVNPDFFIPELGTSSRNEKIFTPEMPINLRVGNASIIGDSGSVLNNTNISITTLRKIDMPELASGMVNVTSGANGYRFLPHGTIFSKNMQIEIGYDASLLPAGYSKEDIVTYYFDEKTNTWLALEKGNVDSLNNMIVSNTTHFTDFINAIIKVPESPDVNAYTPTSIKELNAADPFATFPFISPPTANNNGTANFSYPLQIPAGRQGMQPNLALQYSSSGGNGWLGLGFDISVPSITVETRWGVPLYNPNLETESYLVGGEQLLPLTYRAPFVARETTQTEKIFQPRVEGSFNRIIRHGTSPKNYWWEIIDRNGNKSYYGKSHTSDSLDVNSVLRDDEGNIAHWALTETEDLFENKVHYFYDIVLDAGIPNGTVMGKQIYIREIKYTGFREDEGKYKVVFIRENKNDYHRLDKKISARYGFKEVTADVLKNIDVFYDTLLIKRYYFGYKTGAFLKLLLTCVGETTEALQHNVGRICDEVGNDQGDGFLALYHFDYYNDCMIYGDYQPYQDTVIIEANVNAEGNLGLFSPLMPYNRATSLGGTQSHTKNFGGSLSIGFDSDITDKNRSLGGDFTYNCTKSNGLLTHVDINGDGLPDIVFKDRAENKLKYRKQKFNPNTNRYYYDDQTIIIAGVKDFLTDKSISDNLGAEGLCDFFTLSGSFSLKSNNITNTYFTDVNHDGLPDIVIDNEVYFNKHDGTNSVYYERFLSDTLYFSSDCLNEYILNDGYINDTIFYNEEDNLKIGVNENNKVWFDAIKVWVAPYSGVISIDAPIQLIEDTCNARRMNRGVDGVKYFIQLNDINLIKDSISANDYVVKNNIITDISVNQGDKIYFRLNAKKNRSFDNVDWGKAIKYTDKDSNLVDASGIFEYKYDADEDFVLTGREEIGLPFNGKIRVHGNFIMPQMSDTVWLQVEKNSMPIYTEVFPTKTAVNISIDTLLSVLENDVISIRLFSYSNIKWQNIQFEPQMFYDTIFVLSSGDTISSINIYGEHTLNYYPIVKYDFYPRSVLPPKLQYFSTTTQVRPKIYFTSPVSGEMTIVVKTSHQGAVARRKLIIQNGLITNGSNTITLSGNNSYYFDFNSLNDSIADYISWCGVTYNLSDSTNASLQTAIQKDNLRFGSLYRGWGQFVYNNVGNDTVAMNQANLVLSDAYTTTIDTSIFSTNVNDSLVAISFADSLMNNPSNAYNPMNATFLEMYPNGQNWDYRCFGDFATTKKHYTSLSRSFIDTLFEDSPLSHSINQTQAKAPKKYSIIETTSFNGGYSLLNGIIPLGASTTWGNTKVLYDFMDMNGDGYPDIVGPNYIQYTKPQGSLSNKMEKHTSSGMTVSENNSVSGGITVGANYVETVLIASASPSKAARKIIDKSNISGSGGYGNNESLFMWVDINGDGLPDKVTNDGRVHLNLGYRFAEEEQWNFDVIRTGNSISYSLSAGGYGEYTAWNSSIATGLSISGSTNITDKMLSDINGDGLVDLVTIQNNKMYVALNNGAGFLPMIVWDENIDQFNKSKSINLSVNGAFTIGIPFNILGYPMKITINPSISGGYAVNRDNMSLMDIDNDGFLDIVQTESNDNLIVKYSSIGKTNMLKSVQNFANGRFDIDYKLTQCSYESPIKQFVMSELKVFDGHIGDGVDTMRLTFEYDSACYSRYERQSFGFKVVKTHHHYTNTSQAIYRTTTEKYHNDVKKYMFKGLKYYDEIASATGNKFIVNTYKFDLKEIDSGFVITDANAHCMGAGYPALSEKTTYFYEGQQNYQKSVRERYEHGTKGNVKKYYYDGELAISTDDYYAEIYYHPDINTLNIVSIPSEIVVRSNYTILQKRMTEINYDNGSVETIKVFSDQNNFSDYFFEYYSNGNLQKMTLPPNKNNQRNSYTYEYDDVVQQYPISVTDTLGYTSQTTYLYDWGNIHSTTDIAGNTMMFKYDKRGRLINVQGPYEMENSIEYTIKHEYWIDDNLSYSNSAKYWARTRHYNPDYPDDDIVTVTFADGLGRNIQTKKTSVVYDISNNSYHNTMTVSGVLKYDAFGRLKEQYLPISESIGSDSIFNPNIETHYAPTRLTYDVLDRKTNTILPDDAEENISYGFGVDNNVNQFLTTISDFNHNESYIYTDAKGNKTKIIDPNLNSTRFTYNLLGLPTFTYDPENNQTKYSYDLMGRLIQRQHPDAGITDYSYDNASNIYSQSTQDLSMRNLSIDYEYYYDKLTKITYPDNPEMNVKYEYGAPNSGNETGRLIYQEDATSIQQFKYGKLGELTENIRTFVLPDQQIYSFGMKWNYDTWNRIKTITYADGEEVNYEYDKAGMLVSMNGIKGNDNYSYLVEQGYDKFGDKIMMKYGNDITTFYEYEPLRRRLSFLYALDEYADTVQSVVYHYDSGDNITAVEKSAQRGVNGVSYSVNLSYQYDDNNRLTRSDGLMNYDFSNYSYRMDFSYSSSGNILNKYVCASTLETGGNGTIHYSNSYSYNQNKPHAVASLNNGEKSYVWSANGNMNVEYDQNTSDLRFMHWDEENRLTTLHDQGKSLNYYTYDASGERTLKLTGNMEEMNINGQYNINAYNVSNYTLYTSSFMVVNPKLYTKHYYIEGDRIVSKIGGGMELNIVPLDTCMYAFDIEDIDDYKNKSDANSTMMYRHFDSTHVEDEVLVEAYFGWLNDCANYNETEKEIYFYHKDHLGSSTQITDRDAVVIHHIEYMPSGELFAEQRNSWGTNYKFNGKELDSETNLYYYGARYYTAMENIWLSVDPLSDKYPSLSPYAYCALNPVILVDPDGMEFYVTDNEQSRNDIKSLVSDDNKHRISYDNGRIKIDTKGMTEKDIKADAGLSLLIDMDNSDKKMLYESTDMTTINSEDCETFQYPVYNKNNTDGVINASVGGKDSQGGNTFKPKDGFDGQVVVASTGSFWSTETGRDTRTSTVFHELSENYERTHFGFDYKPNSSNRNYGAHQRAADREYQRLYGNPTPGNTKYSPK